jgi:hypothetical protein
MKEHSSAVDWRGICASVVGVQLLPCGVDVVAKVMLMGSKASIELTLCKVIYSGAGKLSCCRHCNITLGGRGSRRGFTDRCMPASLCVG